MHTHMYTYIYIHIHTHLSIIPKSYTVKYQVHCLRKLNTERDKLSSSRQE